MMTQSKLKELLYYDEHTGIFTWKVSRGTKKAGEIAGTLHHSGYITISIDRLIYQGHRLACLYMTGNCPEYVDHENTIRHDNKWTNIRKATWNQNQHNASLRSDNTTGVKGITLVNPEGYPAYSARVMVNGKTKAKRFYLSKFASTEAALSAATKWVQEYRLIVHREYTNHG